MKGHAGKLGEDGVEEGRGVLGDIGGHTLQQEQHSLHRLGHRGGGGGGGAIDEDTHRGFHFLSH